MKDGIKLASICRISPRGPMEQITLKLFGSQSMQTVACEGFISLIECTPRMNCPPNSNFICLLQPRPDLIGNGIPMYLCYNFIANVIYPLCMSFWREHFSMYAWVIVRLSTPNSSKNIFFETDFHQNISIKEPRCPRRLSAVCLPQMLKNGTHRGMLRAIVMILLLST